MAETLGLVVAAYEPADAVGESLVAAVVTGLGEGRDVRVLDLPALGFTPRMSAAERRAYHTEEPIVDPMVREHAGLVAAATALVFVYPTRWWQPPAVLKAWLERVLLPGVAFVFDDDHKVRPNLHRVQAIAGVTTYDMPKREVGRVADGGRRILLRAVRANAGRKTKTSWSGLYAGASREQRERFADEVAARMARL